LWQVSHVSQAWLLWRQWWPAWPLPALALLVLGRRGDETVLVAFFSLILLWPLTLAVGRVAGQRAGAAAGAAAALLLAVQVVLPAPVQRIQPVALERRFAHPGEIARHTIRLPSAGHEWQTLWARTPSPEAYVYVQLVREKGASEPGLVVRLNGVDLGPLTAATTVGEPQVPFGWQDEQVWHRLPVSRPQLEADPLVEIAVAPRPDAPPAPGTVGLVGGHSYRPTVPPAPSALFDGTSWSTDPSILLPRPPGARWDTTSPVRYFVELRLVEPGSRHVLAMYY
jgi:hypothetical protein